MFLVSIFFNLSWFFIMFYLGFFSFSFLFYMYMPLTSFCLVSNLFYLDSLSSSLVLLSMWITCMMYLCSYKVDLYSSQQSIFSMLIFFLMFVLVFTFISHNFLIFYIMFEISLIPTLILILGWGYQPERLQAGLYLIMYTMCASLPLLCGILYSLSSSGSLFMFFSLEFLDISNSFVSMWWLIFIMAFMVKIPLYLFHLWLPKAHVEAPVSGSMILAGVLLKLGGYGLFRMGSLISWINSYVSSIFLSISMWGALMTSIICLRQVDMKSLIAYSSVGHMGLLISGYMSMQVWGWMGTMCMMICHGLVSSGLFSMSNMSYENTSTRSIYLTKGLACVLPSLSMFWFLFCIMNMGAPPSLNLFSEIVLLSSILFNSLYLSVLIGISSFLAAAYSLYLYTSTYHGQLCIFMNSFYSIHYRMLSSVLFHFIPSIFLILSSEYVALWF